MKIVFVPIDDSTHSLMKSTGATPDGLLCADVLHLLPGDFIRLPKAPAICWRVVSRLLVGQLEPGTSEMQFFVEQAKHPLDALEPQRG
jgi:hypothetical protein